MRTQWAALGALLLLSACGGGKRPGHFEYGIQYFDDGDYTDAARHFGLAWEEKKQAHALFNLGLAQLKLGDYQAAVRTYRQYLTQNGDDWQAHTNLGHALAGTGDTQAAAEAFEEGIALNGTWPEPYCAFAQHLLSRNTPETDRKALEWLDKAVAIGSEDSTAWYLHGRAAYRLGDRSTARNDFQQAVARDADNRPARMLLADILRAEEDWSGARRHYMTAAVQRADHASLLGAGICHRQLGEYVMAQDALNRALRKAPDDPITQRELLLTNLEAAKANLAALAKKGKLDPQTKTQLEAAVAAMQEALKP
ncbi:MAG: tetratricopeptide repeat protein [Acidobacteriota bacterium]|nr:tetratricopeptide repeat protein [Acidobacteriota bacterium]